MNKNFHDKVIEFYQDRIPRQSLRTVNQFETMSGEEERKVEEILDTRISKGVKQYHVKWAPHDDEKYVFTK